MRNAFPRNPLNLTFILVLVFLASGCKGEDGASGGSVGAPTAGEGPAPAPAPTSAPLPAGNVVSINGGAEATHSLFVNLTLGSVGATEMAVYPNADCSGPVAWRPFSPTLSWVLHQSNTDVFVSAKFRNAELAESSCVFDSILHDDQAPQAAGVTSPRHGAIVEARSQSYSGSCSTEAGAATTATAGAGVTINSFSCSGGVLNASVVFSAISGDTARSITFQTVDVAGNSTGFVHTVYLKEPIGFVENTMGGGVNNVVSGLALQADGKIVASDSFSPTRIARFRTDGSRDTDFDSSIGNGANGEIQSLAVLPDGKILIGGSFTQFNGVAVPRIARLSANGAIDAAFIAAVGAGPSGGSPSVQALSVQSDGKILVGGPFSKWNGLPSGFNSNIHRLNADGSYDGSFVLPGAVSVTSGQSYAFLSQSDGKVIVGARRETTINGQYTGGLFRVTASGALDLAGGFSPTTTMRLIQAGAFARALLADMNGGVVVGGTFTQFGDGGGVARNVGRIVRILASTGVYDASFSSAAGTGFNGEVHALALQDDGRILVGGAFTSFNGNPVGRIARLNADGSIDGSFTAQLQPNAGATGFNNAVRVLIGDAMGRLIVGGAFSALNSINLGRLIRIY